MFAVISESFLRKFTPALFISSLVLTCLTLFSNLGLKMHGSARWLYFGNFTIQPSEILKLFLFLYIGFFLERKQMKLKSFVYSYLPFLTILGITFIVLLRQPDFGSVVTLFVTS